MKVDLLKFLDKNTSNIYIGVDNTSLSPFYFGSNNDDFVNKHEKEISQFMRAYSKYGYKKITEILIKKLLQNKNILELYFYDYRFVIVDSNNIKTIVNYTNYDDVDNIINILSKRINTEFLDKYLKVRDSINNVYIYDSSNLTSFKFEENDVSKFKCTENNLYIFYNSNNKLFNNLSLIKRIIEDFTEINICSKYQVDNEKVILDFKNNKSITLYCQNKNIYKNLLENFKNKLIDDNVNKNKIKRKVINNEKFNNG